ncbi:MAG: hypothetical protein JNN20_06840 [Betaproteobacteria bacterium]|nr:hypothetical protein [Betaproteobacteria bacterium]
MPVEIVPISSSDTGPATIGITDPATGKRIEVKLEFAAEESKSLHVYADCAVELAATRFVTEGHGTKLNFNWEASAAPTWKVDAPPDEVVAAVLHKLRPFVLQDESTSFVRVRSILARTFRDTSIQPFLQGLLTKYDSREMQKMIAMQSNNEVMNSDKMFMTWLNAYEYHRDPAKREQLESLSKIAPLE